MPRSKQRRAQLGVVRYASNSLRPFGDKGKSKMAIYHLSVKAISRSAGRSGTAAAAYRSGEKIIDARTGEIHDYSRKRGITFSEIVTPTNSDWTPTRSELWNKVEAAEKRKDSCVAREHEIALPKELTDQQRNELVKEYAQDLADRHGCAVDYAIHLPHKRRDKNGNEETNDNYHAHLLCTTRKLDGHELGAKCQREQAGQKRSADLDQERSTWAKVQNAALARAGVVQRVDQRSLEAQGLTDRIAGIHVGPTVYAIKRRTGQSDVLERLEKAKVAGEFERRMAASIDSSIVSQTSRLQAALQEREQQNGIRAAAFERIGKNLAAAGRSVAFTGSIRRVLDEKHRAVEAAHRGIEQTIQSTRHHEATGKAVAAFSLELAGIVSEVARASQRIEAVVAQREQESKPITSDRLAEVKPKTDPRLTDAKDIALAERIENAISTSNFKDLDDCYNHIGGHKRVAAGLEEHGRLDALQDLTKRLQTALAPLKDRQQGRGR